MIKNITILPLKNWWIQITGPNISNPPTDKLLVRKAIQAALDMNEIMDAASRRQPYQLNVGFQYPEPTRLHRCRKSHLQPAIRTLAKKYHAEAGYKGKPVVLLTEQGLRADVPLSALVMQQQLQAVGINAQMKVVDWPTSVQMMN